MYKSRHSYDEQGPTSGPIKKYEQISLVNQSLNQRSPTYITENILTIHLSSAYYQILLCLKDSGSIPMDNLSTVSNSNSDNDPLHCSCGYCMDKFYLKIKDCIIVHKIVPIVT